MPSPRGTTEHLNARSDDEPLLLSEVRRLRATIRGLALSQVVTVLAVMAVAAAVERRSAGLKDAVWDAADKAERAAREELPGAVSEARRQLSEVEVRLKAIDAQARSLGEALAPGGSVATDARRVSDDLRRSVRETVRDTVRETVRAEVSAALRSSGSPPGESASGATPPP